MQREALRYTPAKQPVVRFAISHVSQQLECEAMREVRAEIEAVVIGPLAHELNAMAPGIEMLLEGFLVAKSARSKALVLHVTKLELMEGNNHGFQAR